MVAWLHGFSDSCPTQTKNILYQSQCLLKMLDVLSEKLWRNIEMNEMSMRWCYCSFWNLDLTADTMSTQLILIELTIDQPEWRDDNWLGRKILTRNWSHWWRRAQCLHCSETQLGLSVDHLVSLNVVKVDQNQLKSWKFLRPEDANMQRYDDAEGFLDFWRPLDTEIRRYNEAEMRNWIYIWPALLYWRVEGGSSSPEAYFQPHSIFCWNAPKLEYLLKTWIWSFGHWSSWNFSVSSQMILAAHTNFTSNTSDTFS